MNENIKTVAEEGERKSVCVCEQGKERQPCKLYLGLSVALCSPGGELICSTDRRTAHCTTVILLLSCHNEIITVLSFNQPTKPIHVLPALTPP